MPTAGRSAMSGRDTDPRAFVLDPKVLAQVADQGAADRARAKIEADVELKKAVEGFSAEGSLPPYMPEAGSKIAVEMIAPGAAPPSREEEPAIPTETAPSSVVIAPEVFAAPVLPGAPAEVAQEPSPGSEQNDVLVSLAPAPAHNTTRKLQKPPGATAFLKAGAPDTEVYVLIGSQGSGKSTWAKGLAKRLPTAIIFDAILVKHRERSPILAAAEAKGLRAVAVWFRTPLELCLARNAARPPDEVVAEQAIKNVFAAIEAPSLSEGFAQVIEVHPTQTDA